MEFEQILQLIDAVSDSELASFRMEKDGIRLSMTTDKMPAVMMEKTVLPEAAEQTGVFDDIKKTGTEILKAQETAAEKQETAEKSNEKRVEFQSDKIVKAPLVGTFYAAPSEDAEPFVKAGDTVKKGQVIGIIEAMKLMNEIESEYDGVIDGVLIENEQVVEYGQPLFRIR